MENFVFCVVKNNANNSFKAIARIFLLTVSNQAMLTTQFYDWQQRNFHTYQVKQRQPKSKNILTHAAMATHTTQIYD